MGSHVFTWEHPANEVYVTGTFDDWSKSQKLEKVGNRFEKKVELSNIDERIYYKYVVDGNWILDHTDPQEVDPAGNTNNVLPPEHIIKNAAAGSSDLPGAFPETPAAENQAFGISPLPASGGIGNPVSTRPGEALPIQTKSINDRVTLDKDSYDNAGSGTVPPQLPDVVTPEVERSQKGGMFGLNSTDTTSGAGTRIPEAGGLAIGAGAGLGAATLASTSPHINSVGTSATTAQLAGQVPLESQVPDVVEKSQEKAHASPEASANPEAVQEKSAMESELTSKVPEAPATSDNSTTGKAAGIATGVAASATAAAAGAAAYVQSGKATQDAKSALPVSTQQKIDEYTKSTNGSAATGTPIAPIVPDTVQESIAKSHQSPEAAANPEAVQEKSAVEAELLQHGHSGTSGQAIAPTVPDAVQESITEAHQSPEAAANPEAVQEKSAVESELLKKVQPEESAGQPAPTASAATATTAPTATTGSTSTSSDHTGAKVAGGFAAGGIGAGALAAIASHKPSSNTGSNTAATSSTPVKSTSTAEGLNAPATAPAQTDATADAIAAKSDSLAAPSTPARDITSRPIDSRDVSPMTRGPADSTSGPTVTSGLSSAKIEEKSAAPAATPKKESTPSAAVASSSVAASPASTAHTGESPATDKKSKRKSGFFGKLKEKFQHKDKS